MKKVLSLILVLTLLPTSVLLASEEETKSVTIPFPDVDVELSAEEGKLVLTDVTATFAFGTYSNSLCISAKLKNLTNETWKSITLIVKATDTEGREHKEPIEFDFKDLVAPDSVVDKVRGCFFYYRGQKPVSVSATFFKGKHPLKIVDYVVLMEKPVKSERLIYEDSKIYIAFEPIGSVTPNGIVFTLLNKTDNPIEIDWNQIAFIDQDGTSNRVIHSGVRYMESDKSMPPTIVPPKTKIFDVIVPAKNIQYKENWEVTHLFPIFLRERIKVKDYEGKTFGIFMPIKVDSKVKSYTFMFRIISVKIRKTE